jgi:hypothetical protein
VVPLAERELQVGAFKEINKTIKVEVREDWQAKIDGWVKERSGSNPYILSIRGESLARTCNVLFLY